jgi:thiamine pyrophosphate-dependent acetolactate synthase large subunit-like protein
MNRIDALRVIDDVFASDPLVVTCGATARELASFSRRDTHLPLLDSMGLTCAVGLGVSLGLAVPVCVVDGDGSLLMGFSILATLASYAPSNLTVALLDNGQHASADLMASQAEHLDLSGAARGLGIDVVSCTDPGELRTAVVAARESASFTFVSVRIEPGNTAGIPLLLDDPAVLAGDFKRSVRGLAAAPRVPA